MCPRSVMSNGAAVDPNVGAGKVPRFARRLLDQIRPSRLEQGAAQQLQAAQPTAQFAAYAMTSQEEFGLPNPEVLGKRAPQWNLNQQGCKTAHRLSQLPRGSWQSPTLHVGSRISLQTVNLLDMRGRAVGCMPPHVQQLRAHASKPH